MAKNIAVNFFEKEEPTFSVKMPKGSTFEAVRQRWQEIAEEPASSVIFTCADGNELPVEGSIDSLISSNVPLLAIFVFRAEEKMVRILGATSLDPIRIQLKPRESVGCLTERLKALLGIEEGRFARLLRDGRPMEDEGRASVQLAGCTLADLDILCHFAVLSVVPADFHPILEDQLGRRIVNDDLAEEVRRESVGPFDANGFPAFARTIVRRHLYLFASQPCRALAGEHDGGTSEWRATASINGACIAGDEPLSCILMEPSLLHGEPVGVVLERQMVVHVDDKMRRRQKTVAVWPSARLGDFMASSGDCVLLDGQLADPRQRLFEVGAQEGSTIAVTRLASLSVFDETGALRLISADLGRAQRRLGY